MLVDKMKAEMVENPPIFSLFLVLMSYTIIPIVAFSPLFYKMIQISEFVIYYSFIIAPIVMFLVAAVNHGKRHFSRFHPVVYKASLIYLLVAPMPFVAWLFLIWRW
jgi:hypothetical protein